MGAIQSKAMEVRIRSVGLIRVLCGLTQVSELVGCACTYGECLGQGIKSWVIINPL